MKPCEDWHRKIVRVLDNEAGHEDEREVAEHLHVCASCREFHDKFAKIRGEFRSVAEPRVPTGIRQNLVKEIERVLQKLIVGPSPSEKPQGTKAEAGDVGSIVDAGRQSHGALQPGEARATFETPSEANVGMQTSCSSSTDRTYRDSVLLRHPRWRWYLSAAAAVLIAGIAFLGGRLSVPRMLPMSVDIAPPVTTKPDGITVPSDLVAWLDTARLYRRLGMEGRMARAVECAGRLLPYDAMAASSVMGQSNTGTGDGVFENQNKHSILAEILRPHESVESVSGIMAQSFGGYNHESKMD